MEPRATPLSRVRQLVTALRGSPPLWWSFLYFFCLLTGYYVLRPLREATAASAELVTVFPTAFIAWFQRHGVDIGDFTLQVLFTGTFLGMLLLQPVYGALVSRFPRRVFLPVVYLAFIGCLIGFHVAFDAGMPGRGAVFFVWVAVFNLFAVSVFWSFMADVFSNDEAKRVYGYIGAGGTVGGFLGPALTRFLGDLIGSANLILVSAGLLAVCLACIVKLGRWARQREQAHGLRSGEEAMGGGVLAGLRLILSEPLMRAFAILMFFGVGVGTLLYNEQFAIARTYYPDPDAARRYFAGIDLAVNTLTLTIQVLFTRALLTRFGVGPVLLIPAVAVLFGFAVLAASPLPLLVAAVQVLTRGGEFSLGKPARETIYTRVEREWRYKAKAAVDTVVYRGGDLSFVWLHKALALFGSSAVFAGGVGVAAAMTFGAWRVVREQAKLAGEPNVAGASPCRTPAASS